MMTTRADNILYLFERDFYRERMLRHDPQQHGFMSAEGMKVQMLRNYQRGRPIYTQGDIRDRKPATWQFKYMPPNNSGIVVMYAHGIGSPSSRREKFFELKRVHINTDGKVWVTAGVYESRASVLIERLAA